MHNIYYLGLSGEHRCPLGYLFYKECTVYIKRTETFRGSGSRVRIQSRWENILYYLRYNINLYCIKDQAEWRSGKAHAWQIL